MKFKVICLFIIFLFSVSTHFAQVVRSDCSTGISPGLYYGIFKDFNRNTENRYFERLIEWQNDIIRLGVQDSTIVFTRLDSITQYMARACEIELNNTEGILIEISKRFDSIYKIAKSCKHRFVHERFFELYIRSYFHILVNKNIEIAQQEMINYLSDSCELSKNGLRFNLALQYYSKIPLDLRSNEMENKIVELEKCSNLSNKLIQVLNQFILESSWNKIFNREKEVGFYYWMLNEVEGDEEFYVEMDSTFNRWVLICEFIAKKRKVNDVSSILSLYRKELSNEQKFMLLYFSNYYANGKIAKGLNSLSYSKTKNITREYMEEFLIVSRNKQLDDQGYLMLKSLLNE